jgi:hypothetical protein
MTLPQAIGVLFTIGLVLAVVLWRRRQPTKLERMVREFRSRSGLSAAQAADALDNQVSTLKKLHPGKKLEWYVERALAELTRDQR